MHVRTILPQNPPFELQFSPDGLPWYLLARTTPANDLFGEAYGAEMSAAWQPFDAWRLRAHYTFLQMQLHARYPAAGISELEEGASPRHQIFLSSAVDLGRHVEWDLGLRHVDHLPSQRVRGYTELESRLAWKPTKNSELAIVGNNLLHDRHREFAPELLVYRKVAVGRAVYAKVTVRF